MFEDPIFDPWSLPAEERPESLRRAARWRARPPRSAVSRDPVGESGAVEAGPGRGRPGPARGARSVARFRAVVRQRVRSAAAKLVDFRHAVAIDDRLDENAVALRLRVDPAVGPMDDPPPGFVLEISLADQGDLFVAAGRVWHDPLAIDPTSEVEAPLDRADERWVDRLLLDFIERALSRD